MNSNVTHDHTDGDGGKENAQYQLTHDFSRVHYWHRKYVTVRRFGLVGWALALLLSGVFIAQILNINL